MKLTQRLKIMRQHVNPLSRFFQIPRRLPSPNELFEDAGLPIHLDIGSARGKFLLALADQQPQWNHLGLEIRKPLVESAERERIELGRSNLRFLFCNVNVSLEDWVDILPSNLLHRVSIQFPDPWYKRRHQKRRILQPSLLISLAKSLQPGTELFIQSDILEVIEPMVNLIELSNCFQSICPKNGKPWLEKSPMLVATEREQYAITKSLTIYRMLFKRNKEIVPDLFSFNQAWRTLES